MLKLTPGHSYILFLAVILLIALAQIVYHRRYFWRLFRRLSKKAAFLLLILLLLASVTRLLAIPHRHYVYYDEFYFLNVAQNMYYHAFQGSTLKGDKFQPEIVQADFRPGGYSFLLSALMSFFGDSEKLPFYLNSFLGALSVLLIFFIAYLLFSDPNIAFWSAFVFDILPLHLIYSGSGSSDITSLFFVLLAVLSAALYYRQKKASILYLLSSAMVFSCYIRPDNVFLCLLFGAMLFTEARNGALKRKDLLNIIYFSVVLLLPLFLRIPMMLRNEKISAGGSYWSFKYFMSAFLDNANYVFNVRYSLLAAGVFFLYGAAVLFVRSRRLFYLLAGWFLAFFLLYTCFFNGNFLPEKTINADRRFLLCALPYAILAGYGICAFLSRYGKKAATSFILISVIIFSLVSNSFFAVARASDFIKNTSLSSSDEFARRAVKELPRDLYILDYNSAYIISGLDRKAVTLEVLFGTQFYPEQLILLRGVWWRQFKDESAKYEQNLRQVYNFEPVFQRPMPDGSKCSIELLRKKPSPNPLLER